MVSDGQAVVVEHPDGLLDDVLAVVAHGCPLMDPGESRTCDRVDVGRRVTLT